MSGGKISSTKLSFTLPISCQICLEKVKEPVTCPNQHVFCSICMDIWLERNKQCPTCRVDITPQSPVRPIIGGMSHSQSETEISPGTSKNLRQARMELLFRDYENEINNLQGEVSTLKLSNSELRSRLNKTQIAKESGGKIPYCSRCSDMQDLDSMLDMAKKLQDATGTFETIKAENKQMKEIAAKYEKENFDLKHQNRKVKDEIVTRSPMKFSRLTVATLENQLENYVKQVAQLQKALEKNDEYTELLKEKLKSCECGVGKAVMADINIDIVTENQTNTESTGNKIDSNLIVLSEHDYSCNKQSLYCDERLSDTDLFSRPVDEPDSGCKIENILSDDLVSQAFHIEEESVDQSLFSLQTSNTSPFTPSTKFSRLSLVTPCGSSDVPKTNNLNKVSFVNEGIETFSTTDLVCVGQNLKEQDMKARSFTPQMMPSIESPDFKEKLEQIQGNLLHPINISSPGGSSRNFNRRLTFDDGSANLTDCFDLNFLDDNIENSCGDEMMALLQQSEDSLYSVDQETGALENSRRKFEVDFARPQSVFNSELNETSPDPILGGLFQKERSSNVKRGKSKTHKREASHSVVDAGGARITTSKLTQSERDIFTRPSSAPSRTFLLSASRFSALQPLDPPSNDSNEFQPVKCNSPSPLSLRRASAKSPHPTKKEAGIRCVVDGRSPSPMRLVSPDDVINYSWKLPSSSARSITDSATCSITGEQKTKDTISRITLLKKKNSQGKLSMNEVTQPCTTNCGMPTEENLSSSRKTSRKQCLTLMVRSDQSSKRMGDHTLEFVSPIKSSKIETKWGCN